MPREYQAKVTFVGKGDMWMPEGVEDEIEHDESVPMEPVSTRTVRVRVTSFQEGTPSIPQYIC